MGLKVLIIGDGNAGTYHRRAYLEADCEIMAQTGERDDWRRHVPDCDLVSIATPDRLHFEQCAEAIRHGKHVFVEKPPCLRADELKFLQERTGHINFACNLPLVWSPDFLEISRRIPELGRIYLIKAEYNYGRKAKLMDGWRAAADYSMIFGAGIHMIDLMIWYMNGPPSDGAGFGITTTRAKVDTCEAIMRWPDGAIGRLGINGGYEGRHYHRLEIYGDKLGIQCETTEEVDKMVPIKEFVKMCAEGRKVDNTRLWQAMQVCFSLEGQMP